MKVFARNFLAKILIFFPVIGVIAIADAFAKLALISVAVGGGIFCLSFVSKQRLVNNLKLKLNIKTRGEQLVILLLLQLFSQGNAINCV